MAVQIGSDGNIYCEFSKLPFDKIDEVFKYQHEASLIKIIHKHMDKKFQEAVVSLEKEIQAIN